MSKPRNQTLSRLYIIPQLHLLCADECVLTCVCICLIVYAGGFGKAKGHLLFVEAVFVCLHWQMDGVCGQRAQLEADCVSATDVVDLEKKRYNTLKKQFVPLFCCTSEQEQSRQIYFPTVTDHVVLRGSRV